MFSRPFVFTPNNRTLFYTVTKKHQENEASIRINEAIAFGGFAGFKLPSVARHMFITSDN